MRVRGWAAAFRAVLQEDLVASRGRMVREARKYFVEDTRQSELLENRDAP